LAKAGGVSSAEFVFSRLFRFAMVDTG
jgi:hypothetical protein